MKNLFMVCLVLLAFCSCAKNKQQMVKDRIEQYTKEGKHVLGYSSDSINNEYYVVYIDSAQIAVDTLGKSPIVFPLGEMQAMRLLANVTAPSSKFEYGAYPMNMKYLVKSDLHDNTLYLYPFSSASDLTLNSNNLSFSEIKLLGKSGLYLKCNEDNFFLFYHKPNVIYEANPATIEIDRKGKTVCLHYAGTLEELNIDAFDESLMENNAGYDVKLRWDGKVAQMPTVLSINDIYSIPTSVFGTSKFEESVSALNNAMYSGDGTGSDNNSYELGEYGGHQYGIEERGVSRLDDGEPVKRFITKDGKRYIDFSNIITDGEVDPDVDDEKSYLAFGEISDVKMTRNGNVYIIFKSHYFNAGAASWTKVFGVGYVDLSIRRYYNIAHCGNAHFEGSSIRYNEPKLMNPNADCAADFRWRDHWKVLQME